MGGDPQVRSRSRTPLVDLRGLGEVAPLLEPHGILRIHRHYAVNPDHVRTLRLQGDGREELKLEPPVNRSSPSLATASKPFARHSAPQARHDHVVLRLVRERGWRLFRHRPSSNVCASP